MNKRGAALLLALVLSMSLLPAVGVFAHINRLDLTSALAYYHNIKVINAARGAIALVRADLLNDGDGQISWPDPDVSLEIIVMVTTDGWIITTIAQSDRAISQSSAVIHSNELVDDIKNNE